MWGGGLLLATHCDLRIAAENAQLGMPVAKLGTALEYRQIQRFDHLIGASATLDLLLTARLLTAEQAQQIGLCTQIFPLESIQQEVKALVKRMSHFAPLVQAWHKQMLQTVLHKPDLADLTSEEAALPATCFDSADYAEGVSAFLEKRRPHFCGR